MMVMLGQVPGVDQKIVYVRDDKPVEELKEQLVHKPLEDRRGVGKAIRHDPIFIVAWGGNECRLPLSRRPGYDRGYKRYAGQASRRCGPHGVTRGQPGPGEENKRAWQCDHWGSGSWCMAASLLPSYPWRRRSTNELLLESLLDVIVHRLALRDRTGVYSTLGDYSSRQQVTIPWLVRW